MCSCPLHGPIYVYFSIWLLSITEYCSMLSWNRSSNNLWQSNAFVAHVFHLSILIVDATTYWCFFSIHMCQRNPSIGMLKCCLIIEIPMENMSELEVENNLPTSFSLDIWWSTFQKTWTWIWSFPIFINRGSKSVRLDKFKVHHGLWSSFPTVVCHCFLLWSF